MTREEQDKRIAELYEWTTHDLAVRITWLEDALRGLLVVAHWPDIDDEKIARVKAAKAALEE